MRTKKTRILICALLCLLLCITGALFGVAEASRPTEVFLTAAPFESPYLNRIHLSADATQFVFMRAENGKYKLSFSLCAKKTEADFYAMLDSVQLSGLPYDKIRFTAAPENGNTVSLFGAELPTNEENVPQPLCWTVDIEFSAAESVTYTPQLILTYTSGTKYAQTERYRTEIPMLVKVCDLSPLPTTIENAKRLFTLGIYTEDSLDNLRVKLDEIETALRSPQDISSEQVEQWQREITQCIASLVPKT